MTDQEQKPPEAPPPSFQQEQKSYLWVKVLIVIAVVVGAWLVINKVIENSRVQDCVMQGRKNCAPIDTYGK